MPRLHFTERPYDWRIRVRAPDYMRHIEIQPVRETEEGGLELAFFVPGTDKFPNWEIQKFEKGEIVTPEKMAGRILTFSNQWAKMMFESLGELFTAPGPSATDQELEATKLHLDDMRKYFFKTARLEGKT